MVVVWRALGPIVSQWVTQDVGGLNLLRRTARVELFPVEKQSRSAFWQSWCRMVSGQQLAGAGKLWWPRGRWLVEGLE